MLMLQFNRMELGDDSMFKDLISYLIGAFIGSLVVLGGLYSSLLVTIFIGVLVVLGVVMYFLKPKVTGNVDLGVLSFDEANKLIREASDKKAKVLELKKQGIDIEKNDKGMEEKVFTGQPIE